MYFFSSFEIGKQFSLVVSIFYLCNIRPITSDKIEIYKRVFIRYKEYLLNDIMIKTKVDIKIYQSPYQ